LKDETMPKQSDKSFRAHFLIAVPQQRKNQIGGIRQTKFSDRLDGVHPNFDVRVMTESNGFRQERCLPTPAKSRLPTELTRTPKRGSNHVAVFVLEELNQKGSEFRLLNSADRKRCASSNFGGARLGAHFENRGPGIPTVFGVDQCGQGLGLSGNG